MASKAGAHFEKLVAANAYARWHDSTALAAILAAANDPADAGRHAVLLGDAKEAALDFIEAITQCVENGNGAQLTVAEVCGLRRPEVDTDRLLNETPEPHLRDLVAAAALAHRLVLLAYILFATTVGLALLADLLFG